MGRLYVRKLEDTKIYKCTKCSLHLSTEHQVISKTFHGRGGKAYLMNDVVNSYCGPQERRVLMTGLHIVADIFCTGCHTLIGKNTEESMANVH